MSAPAAHASAPAAISGYHVTVLPAHPNFPSTYPRAIDGTGAVAGIASTDPWDGAGVPILGAGHAIVPLRRPSASLNFALGIGHRRLVVGTSAMQPLAWVNGVPTFLAPTAGLMQGEANDANAAGEICGSLVNDITGAQRAIVWPSATSPGIALPLGQAAGSTALAIAENGRVAGALTGGAYAAFGFVGARWDGTSQPPDAILPLPGAVNCELRALNEAGDAVGRCAFPNFSVEAVFHDRQAGTLTGLGFLPGGNYSEARGVSGSRVVVGGSNAGAGVAHAFHWENGVMQDVNGMVLSSNVPILAVIDAVAITDQGLVAAEVEIATSGGTVSRMALLRPVGP